MDKFRYRFQIGDIDIAHQPRSAKLIFHRINQFQHLQRVKARFKTEAIVTFSNGCGSSGVMQCEEF